MKRVCSLIICILLAFSLIGCSNAQEDKQTDEAVTETTEIIEEEPSAWNREAYLDDFGDPIGVSYVRGSFAGTYSTDTIKDRPRTMIITYENDRFLVSASAAPNIFDDIRCPSVLKIKINDMVFQETLMVSSGTEIPIAKSENPEIYNKILTALYNGDTVQVILDTFNDVDYRFDIDGKGFREVVEGN